LNITIVENWWSWKWI